MYNHKKIEEKWRNALNPKMPENAPKYYCLDMFPYPSASGLHVGHWRGYVLSDVISRYKMLQGFDVLHPMGFDAFGLPTENFAIKSKIHPEEITKTSIENYKRQLEDIGATYDWENSVNTTDPNFYKWTQWIFLKMFEEGLAYEKEMPLNWCPTCKIVKANEEVTGGICDRCGNETTKKILRQWMLKITKYADRLLEDLDKLDWPEKVKKMQREWIGKSHGANIKFKLNDKDDYITGENEITVFTTRPDTIFGATFIVLAPEHKLLKNSENEEVKEYIKKTANKSNIDRMSEKEKTGIFTGLIAINPLSGKEMKIYTADYVLIEYGTGAIMAVPAHDERDFEFANKYDLPITNVIEPQSTEHIGNKKEAYLGDGILVNSGKYNGKNNREAISEIVSDLEKQGLGESHISYKLRDWVFSRQRYWGEPIPLIHCPNCGIVPVPELELPIKLPFTENYEPTDTGESPLANIAEFVNCSCPKCGNAAKRETNTMPQWAGSSWYFLRYVDPHNENVFASKEVLKPVDMYIGGVEHAVLHLLYARFYTKFLYDIGVVSFEEPFTRLFNQGMLNYKGQKMSKSLGNIVSPDDVIEKYGRDTLRMYELFVAPAELDTDWDDSGIEGVYRFLSRFYRLVTENIVPHNEDLEKIRHKLIKDITTRMEDFAFNTAISKFMEYSNQLNKGISEEIAKTFIILLAPFAPFIASELWSKFDKSQLFIGSWPVYDEEKTIDNEIEIAIQINGKLKATLNINKEEAKDIVISKAKEILGDKLEGGTVKEIYIPGKIVNIVVK